MRGVELLGLLLCLASAQGYGQMAHAIYFPEKLALDTLHCPTLLPLDSVSARLQLSRCAESWRNAGYLEASIDTLIAKPLNRVEVRGHLGPKYIIAAPNSDSPPPRYGAISIEAAKSFSQQLTGRLTPSDSITVSLVLRDSLLTVKTECDTTGAVPLVEIRQNGGFQLPERTLYALLHFRRGATRVRPSHLPRVNAVLASIAYVRESHPPVLEFVPKGAILHVFLNPRKANSMQAGLGFQPKPHGQGTSVYGNADVDFQSLFRRGEQIRAQWRLMPSEYHLIDVRASWKYILGSGWGAALGATFKRRDSTASMFEGRMDILFAPAVFQTVRAGYSYSRLAGKEDSMNHREAEAGYQIRVHGYSLGYTYEKMNYAMDWPVGMFARLDATISDREANTGPRELRLGVAIEWVSRIALHVHGLQLNGSARYENKDITHGQNARLRPLEYTRLGGARTIRGYLEETIVTRHYVTGSAGISYGVNRWIMPHAFTDAGLFFDGPLLRGVMSVGAGVVAQAVFAGLTVDVARGFALSNRSPRGEWVLHLAAHLRF